MRDLRWAIVCSVVHTLAFAGYMLVSLYGTGTQSTFAFTPFLVFDLPVFLLALGAGGYKSPHFAWWVLLVGGLQWFVFGLVLDRIAIMRKARARGDDAS